MKASLRALREDDGFALISVVMLAAMIAALAIGITASTRRIAYESDNLARTIETRALTEAGLNRIIAAYLNRGDPLRERLKPDGRAVPWDFAQESLSLSVQAESGKLDVNAAGREQIAAVLNELLPAPAAILRRIDEARAARARIASLAALLSPLERMSARRDALERHFTVMTEQRGIDPATAPVLTLQALLPPEQRDRMIEARERGAALPVGPEARTMFVNERPIYTIRAEVRSPQRAGAMRAVIGFDERGRMSVYAWGPTALSARANR
jgi:type II secretory pathway component PulK